MFFNEAVWKYVNEFNAIPRSALERLINNNPEDIIEVTKISVGNYVYSSEHDGAHEVIEIDKDNSKCTLLIEEAGIKTDLDDCHLDFDDSLPMWGTLWSFNHSCDTYWLDNADGIQVMSDIGFRIFLDNETGEYYFGIDEAGFDFYEPYWNKLYEARGLCWHKAT